MSRKISVAEASVILGVSTPTIRRMIRERKLPFYRVGRRIVLDVDELQAVLQSARVAPLGEREAA